MKYGERSQRFEKLMGIKIMMPPEVMSSVAGKLLAKQMLRQMVLKTVKNQFDEHYFAVMMHKGISADMPHLSLNDIAKLLSSSTSAVHHFIAEHMVDGSARGGCKICNQASKELKQLIVEEDGRRGSANVDSMYITLGSISQSRYRAVR